LVPLLTQEETIESVEQLSLEDEYYEANRGKTWKDPYSITVYEKVKRVVIPVGKNGDFILVVSLIMKPIMIQ